jgi:hypothetical protein
MVPRRADFKLAGRPLRALGTGGAGCGWRSRRRERRTGCCRSRRRGPGCLSRG